MAVPKRKTTPSKRNMRRSHHRAGTQLFAEDKKSGELRRPHHIDLSTGMYRGKQIIIKKTKKEKDAEGQAPVNAEEKTKHLKGDYDFVTYFSLAAPTLSLIYFWTLPNVSFANSWFLIVLVPFFSGFLERIAS